MVRSYTINNKISKNIGILYKIRLNLSTQTLLKLYHALIQPCLEYCNIAAGSKYLLDRVFRKKKKVVRAIVFANWNAHTSEIFKRLHILSVNNINKLQACCCVYRAINNLLPDMFCDLFVTNSSVHSLDMHQKEKLYVIPHRLIVRKHSIKIYGIKLWNILSQYIIESPTYFIFKKRYKRYLLDTMINMLLCC